MDIHLGDNVHIQTSRGQMSRLCTWPNETGGRGRIDIGSHTLLTPGLQIVSADHVTISDNVMIASRVYISIPIGRKSTTVSPRPARARVHIGENVWLGEGVKVCKGVTIGANSVIGAGSVVTKTFRPMSLRRAIPPSRSANLKRDAC